jgi:serine/threonine protein kinase
VSVQTEIRIGSEFVGDRIDELIGRGGIGVVYRAYDLRLKRTVALKLMALESALDERFRERFTREVLSTSSCWRAIAADEFGEEGCKLYEELGEKGGFVD